MKPTLTVLAAALALALAAPAYADTRTSDKDKTTQEQKAKPSHPTKQDEETTEAHSQPGTVDARGASGGASAKAKKPKAAKDKSGASAGSSAPTPETKQKDGTDSRSGIDLEQAFKKADIDGDGRVSKAEAAGNERLVTGFDRADKDRDGKLSRAEFDSVYSAKPRATRKTASR